MHRKFAFALAATLGLSAAAPAAATGLQPSFEEVVQQFDAVVFGHEHGPSRGVVQKWTSAPDLALFATERWDPKPYLPALQAHIVEIGRLTGLAVTARRADASRATLRIGFYPRAAFAQMPRVGSEAEFERWVTTSACIALAVQDPEQAGRIVAAAIAIGTDIPDGQRRHCILEELVQAMGLPNDACHYRPSLFCEKDRVFALTGADQILVRTLYDPRLKAGMKRAEALPLARAIIAELLPTAAEG